VRLTPLYDFSHQRGLDPIKGAQQPESEVIDANPDRGFLFDLDPGMAVVEIVALGDCDSLYLQEIDRPDHGMDGVFIIKVLIEFAPAANVVVGARLK